jgi:hypothetical protein
MESAMSLDDKPQRCSSGRIGEAGLNDSDRVESHADPKLERVHSA